MALRFGLRFGLSRFGVDRYGLSLVVLDLFVLGLVSQVSGASSAEEDWSLCPGKASESISVRSAMCCRSAGLVLLCSQDL